MKRRHLLVTILACVLPAWSLCAQENTPPPRPPDAAPAEGAPRPERREGRPNPERREGPQQPKPSQPQRPAAGIFGALDANHDGVIDQEEINRAPELLRKLDRNNDGRIGSTEVPSNAEGPSRRREGGEAHQRDGQRGERRPMNRPEQRNAEQRGEPRGDMKRERGPDAQPPGDRRPDSPRNARPESNTPRREGPAPSPRPDGDARRDNRDGSGPQAQHHHHRHHRHQPGAMDSRMGRRDARPEANRIGQQPGGDVRMPQRGPDQRHAFAPRFDGPHPGPQMDEQRNTRGPAPQMGNREPRMQQRGPQGPLMNPPAHGPQPQGKPQCGPEMRRSEPARDPKGPAMQPPPRNFGPAPQNMPPRGNRGPDRPPQGPAPGRDGQTDRPGGASLDPSGQRAARPLFET